jgi:hypothetical protein
MQLLLHQLEVDLTQTSEQQHAAILAAQYSIAALVVHPSLFGEADMHRIRRQGQYKLIVPIDSPKGEAPGDLKFRGLPVRCLEADGFEIVLTPGKSPANSAAEADMLAEFVRTRIRKEAEIRFVLQVFSSTPEAVIAQCEAMAANRKPSMIRIDPRTKAQATRATPIALRNLHDGIKRVLNVQVKLSGNFSTTRSISECSWANRIGVSLSQLDSIIQDQNKVPNTIKEMLS